MEAQLQPSAQSEEDDVVPPLLGDIEAHCGYIAAVFELMIGNSTSVATLLEAMLNPRSSAWARSLTASSLFEVLSRTEMAQRVELFLAARLVAKFGLGWPTRLAQASAMKLVFLRSLSGTGYVAPT